jgi:hypothetical protein
MATEASAHPVVSRSDTGAALVAAMLVSVLLCALATAVAVVVDVDTTVAANHRDGVDVRHAADAAAEFATSELAGVADWSAVLNGAFVSRLSGGLALPATLGGTPVDPPAVTRALQQDTYASGNWGADTPQWRLFAQGVPGTDMPVVGLTRHAYVLVWVSDDVSESDGNPFADSNASLVLRARALGRRGSRVDVQVLLARLSPGIVRRVSWRVLQ